MKTLTAIATVAMLSAGAAWAEGADVNIDETLCGVLDANGAGWFIFPPALGGDAVVQSVSTPSGNSKVTCNGTLPAGAALPDNRAVVLSDGLCSTGFGITDDFHLVVTKSGRVSLTCHINGSSD